MTALPDHCYWCGTELEQVRYALRAAHWQAVCFDCYKEYIAWLARGATRAE